MEPPHEADTEFDEFVEVIAGPWFLSWLFFVSEMRHQVRDIALSNLLPVVQALECGVKHQVMDP